MAAGGFSRLPTGSVVVALNLPSPGPEGPESGRVRVLVHAGNRARALTRLRNLGLRAVYLRGNAAPPTPDEITAVLHHPDGLIWRTDPDPVPDPVRDPAPCPATTAPGAQATAPAARAPELELALELWHPIRALLRRPAAPA